MLRLALPSMLAQFVSVLYSIVDRIFIGNIPLIGETALAGVGICGPIVTLITSFAYLVGIGGAPLMSIRMGEKNMEGARKVLANCFLLMLVISSVLTVSVFLLKEKLLMWFGASEITFPYANTYMGIYVLGTVFAVVSLGMNQFIICQGFAKVGMFSIVIGAVLNIILDPLFIFGFHMGVAGAAWATVLSQVGSCIFVLKFLFGRSVQIPISFGGYSKRIMRRVLTLGLSPFIIIALDSALIIALNTVLQRYGGAKMGDQYVTCATIMQSFMLLVTMPLGGITGGTQAILGYNYGARNSKRVIQGEKYIMALSLIFTAVMFVVARTCSKYFVLLFTSNKAYIEMSIQSIKIFTLAIIPLGAQYVFVDGMTGMGIAKVAISLSIFRKTVYMALMFLIPAVFGITKVFYAEPVTDVVSVIVSTVVYMALIGKILHQREQSSS